MQDRLAGVEPLEALDPGDLLEIPVQQDHLGELVQQDLVEPLEPAELLAHVDHQEPLELLDLMDKQV